MKQLKAAIETALSGTQKVWRSCEGFLCTTIVSMTQDDFTKLFRYMEEFRSEVNEKFTHVDKKFDQVQSRIDGLENFIRHSFTHATI